MPQPVRLRVACDWHPSDNLLRRESAVRSPSWRQALCSSAYSAGQVWPVIGRSHGLRLVTLDPP